ncbi:hypothetical protein CLV30_11679 [Haloactinopolyspora alba]|uniref:Uncharacterized protein n=1 Tax=Haloactinopolyspora alba TaxID=648780 RepID=A0A2P8DT94_9ACTN|nr:hypothetical protein [Haloactinopolyspora alba]PSL00419.1 hypothetical protein CLV30_11679 [Haloactinopolyspora alba]
MAGAAADAVDEATFECSSLYPTLYGWWDIVADVFAQQPRAREPHTNPRGSACCAATADHRCRRFRRRPRPRPT